MDQLAYRDTETVAAVDVFLPPVELIGRHHLPPAIRQCDMRIEIRLEAAQRMGPHPLQKRRMHNLTRLKPDRAADEDRRVAIVRIASLGIALGDDATRFGRNR